MASSSDMKMDQQPSGFVRSQSTKEESDDIDLSLAIELMDCVSPYYRRSFHSLPEYIKLCEEYKKHSGLNSSGLYSCFHFQIKSMFVPYKFNEETLIGAYKIIRKHEPIEIKAARKAFCTAKAQNYPSKNLKTRIEEHPTYELHLANSDPTHAYVRCLVDNKDEFLPGLAKEAAIDMARANTRLEQANALRVSFHRHLFELAAKNEEGQTPLHISCAKDKFTKKNDDSDMDLPLAAELMDSISPFLKRSFRSLPEYIPLCVEYKKQAAFGWFHDELKNMFVAEKFNEETFIRAYHFIRYQESNKLKAARKAFCTAKAQNYPSKKNLKTRIEKHHSYKLHLANTDHTHALVRCLAENKDKFLPGIAKEAANDIARNKLGGILHQTAGLGQVVNLQARLGLPTTELEARNEKEQTPLHVACVKGQVKCPALLVKYGANLNALQKCASQQKLQQVKCAALLIKAGANLNARDENKDTALHYAARNGNIKLVTLLLESGADVTCKNNKNETPLDLVRRGDHYDEIWKLFRKFAVSDQVLGDSSDMHMDSTTMPLSKL